MELYMRNFHFGGESAVKNLQGYCGFKEVRTISRQATQTSSNRWPLFIHLIRGNGTQGICGAKGRNGRSQLLVNCKTQTCADEEAITLVHENIGNKIVRRYIVGKNHQLQILEEATSASNMIHQQKTYASHLLICIPPFVRDLFLPSEFPDDYLRYMLWQFPTNVTGWICSTLVTSSLLKAVGIGSWAGSTVAATAAIKWVSKDGIGALGRLFVGWQFGRVFDDDPKQWRMYADFIGSFASIFELATVLEPGLFLPLASLGHLTKAVATGLKNPSARVIQNHFAISENMGEISAKEEVWAVAAEIVGLLIGVLLLVVPDLAMSYPKLLWVWALLRSLHLCFRYMSLSLLEFTTINYKRAFILAESHVSGAPFPGCKLCNGMEKILIPWQVSWPHIHLGCSLQDAISDNTSVSEVEELLGLYMNEKHVLIFDSNSSQHEVQIIFKEGATSMTVLRSIWQAQWLMFWKKCAMDATDIGFYANISTDPVWKFGMLRRSVHALNTSFDDFLNKLRLEGWELHKIALRLPLHTPYFVDTVSNAMFHNVDSI